MISRLPSSLERAHNALGFTFPFGVPKSERELLHNRLHLASDSSRSKPWLDWAQGVYFLFYVCPNPAPLRTEIVDSRAYLPNDITPWPVLSLDFSLGMFPTQTDRSRSLILGCQQVLNHLGEAIGLGCPPSLQLTRKERAVTSGVEIDLTYRDEGGLEKMIGVIRDELFQATQGADPNVEKDFWAAAASSEPLNAMARLSSRCQQQLKLYVSTLFRDFARRLELPPNSDSTLYLAGASALLSKREFLEGSYSELSSRLSDEDYIAGEKLVTIIDL